MKQIIQNMTSNEIDHQALAKYGQKYIGVESVTFTAADKITHLVVHKAAKFTALTDMEDDSLLTQSRMTTATEVDPFFIIHAISGRYIKTVNVSQGSVFAIPAAL